MTNQSAFDAALRLIGELPGSPGLEDYLDRAPSLLCAACRALAAADRHCRSAMGLEEQVLPDGSEFALEDPFPLCDALLPATAAHLAASLLFDENPTLSAQCQARFRETVQDLLAALPASLEMIKNRY
ncbi:MAG: hypothetical protein IKD37_04310 [Clostridia bacterium]|nr:hypothetical protein [Clostridia bacterium]